MRKRSVLKTFSYLFVVLFVSQPLWTGLALFLGNISSGDRSETLFQDVSNIEPVQAFNPANSSYRTITDDSEYPLLCNNTDQNASNGTHYTLILYETLSFSGVIVVPGVSINTGTTYRSSSTISEDLREKIRFRLLLQEIKTGLKKSIRNADRFFGKAKSRSSQSDNIQHSLLYEAMVNFGKYPNVIELILLPFLILKKLLS